MRTNPARACLENRDSLSILSLSQFSYLVEAAQDARDDPVAIERDCKWKKEREER